jgi:hypothetical protein
MKSATITVDNDVLIVIAEKMFTRLKEMTLENYPDIDLKDIFLDSFERFLGHIFEVGIVTYRAMSPLNDMFMKEIFLEIKQEKEGKEESVDG